MITVGLDTEVEVDPSVVVQRVASISEAIDAATEALGSTRTIGRDTSTFELRARGNGGEDWEPVVVFAALDHVPADLAALGERVGGGLAVVVTVPPSEPDPSPPMERDELDVEQSDDELVAVPVGASAGRSWLLREKSGSFVLDPLGVMVQPCTLTSDQLDDVNLLLSSADAAFEHSTAHDGGFGEPVWPDDIAGEIEALNDASDDVETEDDEPVGEAFEPALSPAGVGCLVGEAPFAEPDWSLLVHLLGHVEVVSAEGVAVAFERSKALELVVWLSQHRRRPTRSAARAALWELDVRDSTFANVVSDARRALARTVAPAAGEEWMVRTLTDQLPLHDGVITDADVLARRVAHARVLPAGAAIEVLRPGLELVTGMPFAGTSYLWPDAEGITSSLTLLVISAATDLANRYLELADADGVFWATGQGLQVLAGHEELIALRMRAHARAGDLAGVRHEWETYERALDADPWAAAHPSPKLVDLRRELLTAAS